MCSGVTTVVAALPYLTWGELDVILGSHHTQEQSYTLAYPSTETYPNLCAACLSFLENMQTRITSNNPWYNLNWTGIREGTRIGIYMCNISARSSHLTHYIQLVFNSRPANNHPRSAALQAHILVTWCPCDWFRSLKPSQPQTFGKMNLNVSQALTHNPCKLALDRSKGTYCTNRKPQPYKNNLAFLNITNKSHHVLFPHTCDPTWRKVSA